MWPARHYVSRRPTKRGLGADARPLRCSCFATSAEYLYYMMPALALQAGRGIFPRSVRGAFEKTARDKHTAMSVRWTAWDFCSAHPRKALVCFLVQEIGQACRCGSFPCPAQTKRYGEGGNGRQSAVFAGWPGWQHAAARQKMVKLIDQKGLRRSGIDAII